MHARPDLLAAPSRPAPRRLIALGLCVCMVAVAAGGCGRRGRLEPPTEAPSTSGRASASPASARSLPLSTSAAAEAPDSDAVRDGDELPASATAPGIDSAPIQTNRGAKKGYKIPKDPFILDAIL
ncbi:hypothetical protein [Methylobacterium gnaphalii]|nr:hypothetical protein [Methylobacterium gnaphalii]GJD69370.1 hypothetical protein MMMDOFMJ_2301 [Methylobacterium gnaphalii]